MGHHATHRFLDFFSISLYHYCPRHTIWITTNLSRRSYSGTLKFSSIPLGNEEVFNPYYPLCSWVLCFSRRNRLLAISFEIVLTQNKRYGRYSYCNIRILLPSYFMRSRVKESSYQLHLWPSVAMGHITYIISTSTRVSSKFWSWGYLSWWNWSLPLCVCNTYHDSEETDSLLAPCSLFLISSYWDTGTCQSDYWWL